MRLRCLTTLALLQRKTEFLMLTPKGTIKQMVGIRRHVMFTRNVVVVAQELTEPISPPLKKHVVGQVLPACCGAPLRAVRGPGPDSPLSDLQETHRELH